MIYYLFYRFSYYLKPLDSTSKILHITALSLMATTLSLNINSILLLINYKLFWDYNSYYFGIIIAFNIIIFEFFIPRKKLDAIVARNDSKKRGKTTKTIYNILFITYIISTFYLFFKTVVK
jgi:hypothetical protein